ncbi:aromatic acid exporter family protein [Corynebacterium sp. zg-331]|uniref:FUSC family protein n=1 Tax=unclassified Corynebacterium TaxID=2624378 RepID=UPI00128D3AC7|nr:MULTISPECIES: FUSC family protein [unclassified Corynebacterium]MBC3185772.1 aromatic acid exporter family protein [Corynebacterium sp. zg-331]MPV52265.1 aromatic acid exporter family protein [Corynebacterium sp. zg331]
MAKQKMSTLARLRTVDQSLHSRTIRVRKRAWPIVQSAIAAGLAFWVAHRLFGHPVPFFAPIAAVIILGLEGGDRLKRAVEMSIGCVVGVALGDLLFYYLGPGAWQISVAVAISLLLASFISSSPLVNNQAAIGSILIATIMPPGTVSVLTGTGSTGRVVDAMIGSAVGILVVAFIPSDPLNAGRQEISNVLGIASSVLQDVSQALCTGDLELMEDTLAAVRGTQGTINAMLAAAKTGRESTTLSPLMWRNWRRIRTLERLLIPVDNSIRNVRVLARRAQVLIEDGDVVSPAQVRIIDELSDVALQLSEMYERGAELDEAREIPVLVNQLRRLGGGVSMAVVENRVLSAHVVLAQSRSLIVDFLQICGMSRESALAVLVPTSATPAYLPEVWEE